MRERHFPESYAALVGLVGIVACQFATLFRILFREVGLHGPPRLVVALLPVVQKFGFEQVAGIHMCHEVVHFVGLGDCEPMFLVLDLANFKLVGKGCDVGVGCVAPGIKEVRLDGELFLDRDDLPRLELLNHCPNILIFVTNVVFFRLLHLLRVDGCNDGFDRPGINHLLKSVLLSFDLMFLLEMEELAPLDDVLNFWIEDTGPFDAPVFKVLDSGGERHFGIGEHEREKTVFCHPI